jgi:hypothetical protein
MLLISIAREKSVARSFEHVQSCASWSNFLFLSFSNRKANPFRNLHNLQPARCNHVVPCSIPVKTFSILVQQVVQVIIVPTTLAPVHRDFLSLLLLLAHSFQDGLELCLVDFLA